MPAPILTTCRAILFAFEAINPVDNDVVVPADVEWLATKLNTDIRNCGDERIDPMRGESLADVLLEQAPAAILNDQEHDAEVIAIIPAVIRLDTNDAANSMICFEFVVRQTDAN